MKDGHPGGVLITHGHPEAHWPRPDGQLVINLESMWDDFTQSVDKFIEALRRTPDRRAIVLDRAKARAYRVVMVEVGGTASAIAASASSSSTTIT